MTPDRMAALRRAFPGVEIGAQSSPALWIRPPAGLDWARLEAEIIRLRSLPTWTPPTWRVLTRPRKCRQCAWFLLDDGRRYSGRCGLHGYAVTIGRIACRSGTVIAAQPII